MTPSPPTALLLRRLKLLEARPSPPSPSLPLTDAEAAFLASIDAGTVATIAPGDGPYVYDFRHLSTDQIRALDDIAARTSGDTFPIIEGA